MIKNAHMKVNLVYIINDVDDIFIFLLVCFLSLTYAYLSKRT